MRDVRVWKRLLGVERGVVIEGVRFDPELDAVVSVVRPRKAARGRCGSCGRRCPGYDRGEGIRRWRGLDLGTVRVFLQAQAPRVACPEHGPTVIAVPWARHGSRQTRAFEDTAAWLVTHTSKTAVSELMRVAWRTVGSIVVRVVAEGRASHDPLVGLARIGIDEVAYKRGHHYLTVVVDHDTGRLVWAAPGRDKATLRGFFDALGAERSAAITHVSADAAGYIADVVAERCPNAVRCADPFHVVAWATEALDQVRRQVWNRLRTPTGGRRHTNASGPGKEIKNARWVLWKNPENLSDRQAAKLRWIAAAEPTLHRAYLLKEGLRLIFQLATAEALAALDAWIGWARRCRIREFVDLARRIVTHRAAIEATLEHRLSNGLIESTNTKLRVLTRIAFGFTSPDALIALALLDRGGYCPDLPGRSAA